MPVERSASLSAIAFDEAVVRFEGTSAFRTVAFNGLRLEPAREPTFEYEIIQPSLWLHGWLMVRNDRLILFVCTGYVALKK